MSFYNRDKGDTISPQKYTHQSPFCMLPRGKSGEGAFAQIFNLSWLYTPTSVFQDREHSSQSPCLQSHVVSLHRRRATGWMWCRQYSGWLRCSYPEEQHDHWPCAMRNIQSLLGTSFRKMQKNGSEMTCIVSGSRRCSDVEGKELVVPCIYIFTGKQKRHDRLIAVC